MKEKIGVFGSAIPGSSEVSVKARELGEALADCDVILITGACPGLPYEVALTAFKKNQTEIWGFSPATDYKEQVAFAPDDDNTIYSQIEYRPANFKFIGVKGAASKYRNVLSTATCDGGIVIAGRWGTLNEFTNLYDMGKVIGVLTGTGGVADLLPDLYEKLNKPSSAKVFFSDSPVDLVTQVIQEIRERQQKAVSEAANPIKAL